MGKWLAAIAKGLSYAAGPFKPVVDFVLKLYDGELAERADKKLQELIIEGKDVAQEILEILKEIKQNPTVLASQFANGTATIIELIDRKKIEVTSPEMLQDSITENLIKANLDIFWKKGFVCIKTIEKECIKCWGRQIHTFLAIVERGDFDTSALPREIANFAIISECIRQTFSPLYDGHQRTDIIGELAEVAKGSKVLQIAHKLLVLNAMATS